MRYFKPMITSTAIAAVAIQGAKDGMPDDSNNIDERTVGSAYPADE